MVDTSVSSMELSDCSASGAASHSSLPGPGGGASLRDAPPTAGATARASRPAAPAAPRRPTAAPPPSARAHAPPRLGGGLAPRRRPAVALARRHCRRRREARAGLREALGGVKGAVREERAAAACSADSRQSTQISAYGE